MGGEFRLTKDGASRDLLEPIDSKGNVLLGDHGNLDAADHIESLRTHPVGRAQARRKPGYGSILSVRQANADDSRLISRGVWVRRRRDGTSPQFGSAAQKSAARRQRSRYRSWL